MVAQFSWTLDPPPVKDKTAWKKAENIARSVMQEEVESDLEGVSHHYLVNGLHQDWLKNLNTVAMIGNHTFYD